MPSWDDVLKEIRLDRSGAGVDNARRKYLKIMQQYTGRNVVAYYSGFLQKRTANANTAIDDNDKNALMNAFYGLDRSKGLDLIIHTPGGNLAAAESIVEYVKSIFGNNVRAIVPQIAMSAGTMIALSCKEIVMGKQSNLGPIDPQFGGVSAAGIIEEFKQASKEIKKDPSKIPLWQMIIGKYHPTFLGDCEKAIKWSKDMVTKWLSENMLKDASYPKRKAANIVRVLSSHKRTLNHAKHINLTDAQEFGLKIVKMEDLDKTKIDKCNGLQDCILTIHHAYMQTFASTPAQKIVENHLGKAMIIVAGI